MRRVAGFIIRSSAFVTKELVEILRQTRLILALILGPFLILLLFGLGYRNEARVLSVLFVVPPNGEVSAEQIQQYATTLGPQLNFRGVTTDEQQALRDLAAGRVDAVAIIPGDIEARIRSSEQPSVRLYHREIDPFQASYMEYFNQIYVDELNRRVLRNIAEQGQQEAANIQDDLQTARDSARTMREAFEQGDAARAQQHRTELRNSLDAISLGVGASLGVLQGVEQTVGPGGDQDGQPNSAAAILGLLAAINENDKELENTNTDQTDFNEESQRAAQIEQDLDELDKQLTDFRSIDPRVLVTPFKAETESVLKLKLSTSNFFAPGVIVLLLQHLAVTFAALSIVREKNSGAMELFRVSPITALETLIGKYLSYMFLGVMLAAAISALVVLVLRVPMFGDWYNYTGVLMALLFASLGIGFVISLFSETTSQAVQYSMLALLFAVFFSGFFLDLRLMWPAMRPMAYAIPATYGLNLLKEIMFRAAQPDPLLLAGLIGIGVLLFIISWFLLQRQMKLH